MLNNDQYQYSTQQYTFKTFFANTAHFCAYVNHGLMAIEFKGVLVNTPPVILHTASFCAIGLILMGIQSRATAALLQCITPQKHNLSLCNVARY